MYTVWQAMDSRGTVMASSGRRLGCSSAVSEAADDWNTAIVESQATTYSCHICGVTTKYRRNLWAHQVKFHGRPKKKAINEWKDLDKQSI
jgi:hypothetical protein